MAIADNLRLKHQLNMKWSIEPHVVLNAKVVIICRVFWTTVENVQSPEIQFINLQ